ncbi:MAG: hypothetical protein WB770_00440 [Acidimicrobiales bacterium]
MSDERIGEISEELATICERLDEIVFEALRSAVANGETARPEIERRAVRARNAIERARRILGEAELQKGPDDQP